MSQSDLLFTEPEQAPPAPTVKPMGTVRIVCVEPSAEKRRQIAKQFEETKAQWPQVTCGCGHKVPLRFAYRCVYCQEFFCADCGYEHFGQTRDEYYGDPVLHVRTEMSA